MNDAADRPMRLCFLGCGRIAEGHAKTASRFWPAIQCSFASRELARARRLKEKHRGARAFEGYREAIESADIDAVAVVTPPVSHLELTLAALQAGKDVLLEKPPVFRSADFDEIERACGRSGRFVLVAENYHYKPLLASIREVLAAGTIGEPLFVHLNAVKRQHATGWRDDPALVGGGALYEGGIHWVDFAASLGFEVRSVKAVRPGGSAPLERSMALLFEYRDGPAGLLSYSWDVAAPLKGLRVSRIYGREGGIAFESNGLFVAMSGRRWRVHFPGVSDIQGYRAMFADFLEAWRERREPRMTLAQARRDLELVEEAYRSAGVEQWAVGSGR